MARLSLLAILALAFSGVALAAPPASQEIVVPGDVHTSASWSYTTCGAWSSSLGAWPLELSGFLTQGAPTTSLT